jgi:UDP-N-acetylmuramate dehydrogenase
MQIEHHAALAPLSTFSLPATAQRLILTRTHAALELALEQYASEPLLLLGGGSNSVFLSDVPGSVLRHAPLGVEVLGSNAEHIELCVGAGENWHQLVLRTSRAGWHGLENLALIPGSCGAAPIQNIGAYGVELDQRLMAVQVYDRERKQRRILHRSDCALSYRNSLFKQQPNRFVVLDIRLRLSRHFDPVLDYGDLRQRVGAVLSPEAVLQAVIRVRQEKLPQPAITPNSGSFFKNPIVSAEQARTVLKKTPSAPHWHLAEGRIKLSAAWLIDQCGLRGERCGDVAVSERHALVLVNHGKGNGAQLAELVDRVRARVKHRFQLPLFVEPRLYHQGRLMDEREAYLGQLNSSRVKLSG